MPEDHPTKAEFRALLKGILPEERAETIQDHLESCDQCQNTLDRLSGADVFESNFSTDPLDAPPLPEVPSEPDIEFEANSKPVIPSEIGPYKILCQIATGGMGVVYQARDPNLDRIVAIKLLSPALAANEDSRARFVREATAAAAIEHPNIVPIHAVDLQHDPPYIVMRHIEGETLQERLDRSAGQPLSIEEILPIASAVASALSAAHHPQASASSATLSGLVHRDIKPSNILLERSGDSMTTSHQPETACSTNFPFQATQVYLTDFGLARGVESQDSLVLTRTGSFMGTPQYMSPEQAAGSREIGPSSDLFSLGAVLYTMATGRPPFLGDNLAVLIDLIREQAPPAPTALNPNIPSWLGNLITRLLAKNPHDRPESAANVVATLAAETDLGRISPGVLLGQRSRRWRMLKQTAITSAFLAIGIGIFVSLEHNGTTNLVNRILAAASGDVFTIEGRWGTYASLQESIQSAEADEVILLHTSDPISDINVSIPEGKALTLRAANHFRPTLVSSHRSEPLLTSHASIRLERLTLRQNVPDDGSPPVALVRVEGASCIINRCHLERPPLPPDPAYPPVSEYAIVSMLNGPRLEVVRSRIVAPGAHGIGINNNRADSPSVLRLEDSWLRVTNNVMHNQRDGRIRIEAHRNFIHGSCFLEYRGDGTRLGYELESRNNLFYLDRCFIDHPGATESRIRHYYTWEGAENVYVTLGPLIQAGYRTPHPEQRFRVTYLRDLRRFFARADEEKNSVFTLLPPTKFPVFDEATVLPRELLETTYATRGGVDRLPQVGPQLDAIGP